MHRILAFIVSLYSLSLILYLLSPSPAFASLSSTHYTYDSVGNIKQITNNSQPTTYNYDGVYRLERASGGYSANYSYNPDGEITTKNEGGENLSISYNNSSPIHAPKMVNGKTLVYDANGNLTDDQYANLSITYDYENRPTQITDDRKQITAKYFYDAEGKRVKKEVYDNGTLTKTTYYVNQYFEREIPAGGNPTIRKFYSGAAYRENDTLTYTTADHLSSTTLTTDSTGKKIADYKYYPYGSPITNNQPPTTNLPAGEAGNPPNSWIGQKLDSESNLYFLNARYYSPITGRFVSADSVEDKTSRNNRYLYSLNSPVVLSDPSGNCPPCILLAIAYYGTATALGVAGGGYAYANIIAPDPSYQNFYNDVSKTTGDFESAQEIGYGVGNLGMNSAYGFALLGNVALSGNMNSGSISRRNPGSIKTGLNYYRRLKYEPLGQGGYGIARVNKTAGIVEKTIADPEAFALDLQSMQKLQGKAGIPAIRAVDKTSQRIYMDYVSGPMLTALSPRRIRYQMLSRMNAELWNKGEMHGDLITHRKDNGLPAIHNALQKGLIDPSSDSGWITSMYHQLGILYPSQEREWFTQLLFPDMGGRLW